MSDAASDGRSDAGPEIRPEISSEVRPEAGPPAPSRARFTPCYIVLVVVAALVVLALSWWVHPLGMRDALGLSVLLVLGAASARLRDVESESQIDLSFTAAILLCALPLVGPFGAGLVGALIPLLDLRRAFGPAGVFNSAMTCLIGGASGLAYVAFGGWVPVPASATGGDLLRGVALPLVGADIVLCLVNLVVVGTMIWLHTPAGSRIAVDPFVATLPIYLGYALTGFLFVVLWSPADVGPLAAVFLVAPLVVARWAYAQYIEESRSRGRILQTLAAAGGGRDGSELRSARIDWLVRNLETRLALGGRPAAALRYAATLHDIGTVAVPREMLTRDPHDLTPAQLRVIAAHAPAGAAVLGDIDFLEAAARVVRHHHERWDGRGYPDGLAGADIPLPARILGVIDAFEAVAWPAAESDPGRITEAVAEIRSRAGTQFDPDVVDALVSLFDESHWKSSPLSDQSEPFIDSAGEMWAGSRPRLRHAHPQVSDLLSRDVPPAGPRAAASTALGSTALGSTARGSTARGSTAIGEAPTPAGRAPRVPSRSTAWRRLVTWRDVESLVHRTRAHSERAIGGRLPVGRSGVIVVGASLVALVLLVLAAGFAAQLQGPGPEQAAPVVMVVYFAVLVVAERFRLRIRGRLETAPTAAAVGIALALTAGLPGVPAIVLSTMQIAGVVLAAQLVDWVFVRRHLPGPERFDALVDAAIRGTTVILLSAIVRDVRWSGEPLLVTLGQRPGWWQALLLTTVVGLVLLLEVPPRAARRAETERARWRDTVGQELRDGFGLGTAMAGTGVLIAITETTLGLIAVPLLILPLAITQLAVRRYALTQLAYLQSVRALSRLPEIAGVVRAGHAERVASVAVALGRELHMREGEVRELEFAALLHDIGQVTLRRPIPFGATVLAAPADQDRIAEAGAGILEHSGTLDAVVEVVRYQTVPYHQVMGKRGWSQLASRVVKVANAYDDYLASDPDAHVADAVERLYLGLGHEFDPRVVRALESLTRRYGHDLAAPRASTPPQVTRQRTARA